MPKPFRLKTRLGADGRIVRASGPGLVDLQVNGYAGVDFNGDLARLTCAELRRACQAMRRRGVVMFLVTVVTDSAERMLQRVRHVAELRRQDRLIARMAAGFHIEGPFINPADGPRGAHPLEHVIAPKDRPNLLEEFQRASGRLVRIFTLAPETPGAMELISRAVADGVLAALGHHAADAASIARAVAAGARMSTHLGNGASAMLPRHDNYIQHQLADDRLFAGFIADGHHIPFAALKNFLRAKRPARSVLVSDAISAADMPPGEYDFGAYRRPIRVEADGLVRLAGTPYLAGSALTLDRAVLNVTRHCNVPFAIAWKMASTQPAKLAGLPAPPTIEVDVTDAGFALRGEKGRRA